MDLAAELDCLLHFFLLQDRLMNAAQQWDAECSLNYIRSQVSTTNCGRRWQGLFGCRRSARVCIIAEKTAKKCIAVFEINRHKTNTDACGILRE
jgi:hypothetical protein